MPRTIGEALVKYLEAADVTVIFGIPGVHTIELYRGLSQSSIRHVTARHEQGVGFMADGFARVSGKPGVAFVITGPGVTNILTPMAQARNDSVPMLVVSGVNDRPSLGLDLGHLHELPNQQALCAQVAVTSSQVRSESELIPTLNQAFDDFANKRPGPVHIEIPLDVMSLPFTPSDTEISKPPKRASLETSNVELAVKILTHQGTKNIVILAGGGARNSESSLKRIAEYFDIPVVFTSNARGLMHQHPLIIPASASLKAVRRLIANADCILAVGTELGPTDYDMYRDDQFPVLKNLIRIDICPLQLNKHPAEVRMQGDADVILEAILAQLPASIETPIERASFANNTKKDVTARHTEQFANLSKGAQLSAQTRSEAFAELSADYQHYVHLLNLIRDSFAKAIIVGDSTQLIYAGSMYYDHDCAGGWFHAATGYGALGYGIPAAIGAALAAPERQIICITGDGGAQFSFAELMVAVQEQLPIVFIVWNNQGYLEIESAMLDVDIEAVGCDPIPPKFEYIAKACSIPYMNCTSEIDSLTSALAKSKQALETMKKPGPVLIEISA